MRDCNFSRYFVWVWNPLSRCVTGGHALHTWVFGVAAEWSEVQASKQMENDTATDAINFVAYDAKASPPGATFTNHW